MAGKRLAGHACWSPRARTGGAVALMVRIRVCGRAPAANFPPAVPRRQDGRGVVHRPLRLRRGAAALRQIQVLRYVLPLFRAGLCVGGRVVHRRAAILVVLPVAVAGRHERRQRDAFHRGHLLRRVPPRCRHTAGCSTDGRGVRATDPHRRRGLGRRTGVDRASAAGCAAAWLAIAPSRRARAAGCCWTREVRVSFVRYRALPCSLSLSRCVRPPPPCSGRTFDGGGRRGAARPRHPPAAGSVRAARHPSLRLSRARRSTAPRHGRTALARGIVQSPWAPDAALRAVADPPAATGCNGSWRRPSLRCGSSTRGRSPGHPDREASVTLRMRGAAAATTGGAGMGPDRGTSRAQLVHGAGAGPSGGFVRQARPNDPARCATATS